MGKKRMRRRFEAAFKARVALAAIRGDKMLSELAMRVIDEQYLQTPFFGSRGMTEWLKRQGYVVNRKRVQRRGTCVLLAP